MGCAPGVTVKAHRKEDLVHGSFEVEPGDGGVSATAGRRVASAAVMKAVSVRSGVWRLLVVRNGLWRLLGMELGRLLVAGSDMAEG
jgi:hypothetical protein